ATVGDAATISDLKRLRAGQDAAILVLLESSSREDVDNFLDCGADHVLPLGLQSDRLFVATVSAVTHGRKRREIERESKEARRALAEAKHISRAKMILIARHRIDEEEAHRRVQKMSMERNLPLADMARQIIEAEDLLC
ncbi:MAG: ANTAR domain-containing protein, partial [Pseudomonadota bacterium]